MYLAAKHTITPSNCNTHDCNDARGVDLCKFVFALCIMAIHSGIGFEEVYVKGTFSSYLYPLLFRLAVPYFFVASGYFFGRKVYASGVYNGFNKWGTYLRRLALKLLIFEPVALAIYLAGLYLSHLSPVIIFLKGLQSILFYPMGALWYIQALIIAFILLIPFIRKGKEILALIIGICLYLFALLSNSYFFLADNLALQGIIQDYNHIFISARNGFFVGFIFVTLGLLCAKYQKRLQTVGSRTIFAFTAILYGLTALETWATSGKAFIDERSLFIFYLPLIPAIFLSSLRLTLDKLSCSITLRHLSTSIYLLHAIIIRGLLLLIRHTTSWAPSPFEIYLITGIILAAIIIPVYRTRIRPLMSWIT